MLYFRFVDSPLPTKGGLCSEHGPHLLKLAFLDILRSTHPAGRVGGSMDLTLGELGMPTDLVGRWGKGMSLPKACGWTFC